MAAAMQNDDFQNVLLLEKCKSNIGFLHEAGARKRGKRPPVLRTSHFRLIALSLISPRLRARPLVFPNWW